MSSPAMARPSKVSSSVRAWVRPWVCTQPSCPPWKQIPSEAWVRRTGTVFGASSSSSPRSPLRCDSRPEDNPSRQRVEWLGVARPARRHSGPKLRPDPQFTTTGRRPDVSSNARVEAWAERLARPVGRRAGVDDNRGAARRQAGRNPIASPSGCAWLMPLAASAWSSRPSCPRPAAVETAPAIPSAWRRCAQGGGDAFDGGAMLGADLDLGLLQRQRGPGQQGEDLQQTPRGCAWAGRPGRRSGPLPHAPGRGGRGSTCPSIPRRAQGPRRSARSAPRSAATRGARPSSGATGRWSGGPATGRRPRRRRCPRARSRNRAWWIQRISRRPDRSGCQPGAAPAPVARHPVPRSTPGRPAAPSGHPRRPDRRARQSRAPHPRRPHRGAQCPRWRSWAPRPAGPRRGNCPPTSAAPGQRRRRCAVRAGW